MTTDKASSSISAELRINLATVILAFLATLVSIRSCVLADRANELVSMQNEKIEKSISIDQSRYNQERHLNLEAEFIGDNGKTIRFRSTDKAKPLIDAHLKILLADVRTGKGEIKSLRGYNNEIQLDNILEYLENRTKRGDRTFNNNGSNSYQSPFGWFPIMVIYEYHFAGENINQTLLAQIQYGLDYPLKGSTNSQMYLNAFRQIRITNNAMMNSIELQREWQSWALRTYGNALTEVD